MVEIEFIPEEISDSDNTINVEMSNGEISFLKSFIKEYNPKKIVEIGISAGGNTVNLLKWKNKDAQLFSIDIATQWYRDSTKLSGFMADELDYTDNWKIYRGYDYLDVCEEIGGDIDFIIIDTVHTMPGEFFTFLAALPYLKDGCIVVLHDIHLNMMKCSLNKFADYEVDAYCTGLLFGGVSSSKKWSLKADIISNIGAFVVDEYTRNNITDIFHILCSKWNYFPNDLNLVKYSDFVHNNYSEECYNLFMTCLRLQSNYFNHMQRQIGRVDILNSNRKNNTIEILNNSSFVNIDFPGWFVRDDGRGVVIQSNENEFDLKFKCVGEGLLNIFLRGPDVRDELGKRIPIHIQFNTFKVNDNNVIEDNISVWHDNPYVFKKDVDDGEIVEVHVEWELFKS